MTILANKVAKMKPSPTLFFSAKVKNLKSQGIDVVDLTTGEPDFDTPNHIKEYAISAINEGKTKYTLLDGTNALKEEIQNKFKNDNNLYYEKEEIIVSAGAKQSIFNTMGASLNEGDEVIILSPYWVSYVDIVLFFGGKPVIVNINNINENQIANEIEKNITPKTKWVFLNSPSNPSGLCFGQETLISIGNLLEKYSSLHILSDDIYEYLMYDNKKFYTIGQFLPNYLDRIVTINGVSKSYAMTGWRIGYCGTKNKELLSGMRIIQSQSTSNPCSISQEAAYNALKCKKDFLKEWITEYQSRRNFCLKALSEIKGIECKKPNGAFYLFPDISYFIGKTDCNGKLISNSEDFCISLLENQKVGTVHGAAFGLENHFRISFANDIETLKNGMEKIKEFCDMFNLCI